MKPHYIIIVIAGLLLQSCNDAFLDRYPETAIAPNQFFKTTKDLELYTNTFYEYLNPDFQDGASDNVAIFADASEILNLLRGNITPSTVTGWTNWSELRRINFLLDNAQFANGTPEEINHYIGIARLIRATWYYDMVKRYSDLPWFSNEIKDTDEAMLYKAKDPRTLIVDSVMADLEFATRNISGDMANKTLINKWFAYAT